MFNVREEISLERWPNDCKVAVIPIINAEVFIKGHGGPCIQPHLSNLTPDIANSGWRDYGNRQGTSRLLNTFSNLQIPVSIAMNSYLIDQEPDVFEEIRVHATHNENIDIIGHGLTNSLSAVKHISFEEQVKQSLNQIQQAVGHEQRPHAWLTPGFAAPEDSAKILVDNGIRLSLDATNDDIIYELKSSPDDDKGLFILPYSMETNDISLCMCQGYTGEQYAQTLIDYIYELASEETTKAKAVCLGLHTFIVGTPAKAFHFKQALQTIQQIPNTNSTDANPWRKWFGIIWLLVEVNLISANIFGFSALFKVLPKYGIYGKYCELSTVLNSTNDDCSGQAQQYQITSYAACTYFSKGRAVLLTLLVGSSLSASIWYSIFQVLIDNGKITLSQLSYVWMSFGALMFISSFLFLDWKFPILNLGYTMDTKLEQTQTISTINANNKSKWYTNIYQRVGFWKYLLNSLYILVVLYLSILLMPNILLSVTWYPWVYYISQNDKTISDQYTFAFNMASLSQIILCPMVGLFLAFRAEQSPKQKLLNAAIVQTLAWILNILLCIICMFVNSAVIVPALVFNYIARSVIVAGSQAVISTFFPSEYIGRLTGIMWTVAGAITCIQYGLVHLTADILRSWRAWVIVLALIVCMSCHLIQIWYITLKKSRTRVSNADQVQSAVMSLPD
ncbi:unnamed protein product [Adineta ricciae]|uniref:NodB homology domain-containing protein n=1 Tax=Adineta ricciae TaxID=249248 RepID=A0A814D7M4_ADIRI|nr:unnamed protein product [Adineta ricciae]